MTITKKQLIHYQSVAQQSLDKFKKIAESRKMKDDYKLLVSDWQTFIDNPERIKRYAEHVEEVAGILGFSRELSDNLSDEALMSRVAERFAEVDLAEHVIRELHLPQNGSKLEKLIEGSVKKCDFKHAPHYFESKYTKNISISSLRELVGEALDQIKNSMESESDIGCVWIFTYTQPDDPRQFQQEIEEIQRGYSGIGFDFRLNLQVYGRGLYGDATIL
jgi:hypothetical protein